MKGAAVQAGCRYSGLIPPATVAEMVQTVASAAPFHHALKAEKIAFGEGLTGAMARGSVIHADGAAPIALMEEATIPGAGAACPAVGGEK
jgi:hypothetical protein